VCSLSHAIKIHQSSKGTVPDYGNLGLEVENIYGIPSEKEKALVQIKKLAKVKTAKLALKNKSLKE